MTEEKKSEPMFGIYESELCRAIHGIDDAMECHNLKKKICARGTIEQAPATNENHFVINDTLITAIGEWDKGPHNIVKILELLRACPLAEHDAAIAAQAIVEDRKRPRPPCEECHWQARQHWKLLESVPDKNGFVVFGAKEDPNGHFVSREKAIEFMQIEDGRIKERIAQEREKWEREKIPAAPENGHSCYACLCGQGEPCSRKIIGCAYDQDLSPSCEGIDKKGFCASECTIRIPITDDTGKVLYFTCHKKIAAIAAQARTEVLDAFEPLIHMHNVDELPYADLYNEFLRIYKSLRAEVKR